MEDRSSDALKVAKPLVRSPVEWTLLAHPGRSQRCHQGDLNGRYRADTGRMGYAVL